MEPSLQVYTESPLTQIFISHGIVITTFHAKYNVINTLSHRAKTICSTPQLLKKELQHVEEVLYAV